MKLGLGWLGEWVGCGGSVGVLMAAVQGELEGLLKPKDGVEVEEWC